MQIYLQGEDPGLREVIGRCGGRYHIINNRQRHDRQQVRTLLDKVSWRNHDKGGGMRNKERVNATVSVSAHLLRKDFLYVLVIL